MRHEREGRNAGCCPEVGERGRGLVYTRELAFAKNRASSGKGKGLQIKEQEALQRRCWELNLEWKFFSLLLFLVKSE